MLQSPFVQREQGVPGPGRRPACLQPCVHSVGQSPEGRVHICGRGRGSADRSRPYEEFLSSFKKNGKPLKEFKEAYRITFVVLKNKLKRNWSCLLWGGLLFLDVVHTHRGPTSFLAPSL